MVAAFACVPVTHAAPVEPSGEAHEKLGVALALGELCGNYRPFEYYFLHRVWQNQWMGSAAAKAIATKADAANKGPMGFVEAGKIRLADERALTASYRARAAAIGCANSASYTNIGKVEAYLEAGTYVAQAVVMRGQAQRAPGMSPLSAYQTQVVGAFGSEAKRLFGAQFPAFEQQVGARAQAGLATYSNLAAPVAAAMMEGEQDLVLSAIQFDGLFGPKKFLGQGAWLDDGTGFGRYAAQLEDSKKFRIWRIEGPKAIAVEAAATPGLAQRGSMVLMLRGDGAAVVGLYGGDFEKPGEFTVAVSNNRIPPIAAEVLNDCPVHQCFIVPTATMSRINDTAGNSPRLRFFVTRIRGGQPGKSKSDGIELGGGEWKALIEAVKAKV